MLTKSRIGVRSRRRLRPSRYKNCLEEGRGFFHQLQTPPHKPGLESLRHRHRKYTPRQQLPIPVQSRHRTILFRGSRSHYERKIVAGFRREPFSPRVNYFPVLSGSALVQVVTLLHLSSLRWRDEGRGLVSQNSKCSA